MPCGPISNTQAMIMAMGKPAAMAMTTKRVVQSGRKSAGPTVSATSVMIQAAAP